MPLTLAQRLEQYTIKRPQEVLLLTVEMEGTEDQILIFRGFSSSLMKPTATDPDVPVLSEMATIRTVDRIRSPFRPAQPQYIQQGLTLPEMESLLQAIGL